MCLVFKVKLMLNDDNNLICIGLIHIKTGLFKITGQYNQFTTVRGKFKRRLKEDAEVLP